MSAKTVLNDQMALVAILAMIFLPGGMMLCPPAATAEVYSWTDKSGNVHFTDQGESIPKEYQDKVQVSDEENSRSWEYLATDYGVNYYYDTANVTYLNRNRFSVMIKESYASSGQEEYETQIILDCARLLYKATQSVKVYKNQRRPADARNGGDVTGSKAYRDGFQRFTHPYLVLSKMICNGSAQ